MAKTGRCTVGFDLGGTKMRVLVVDEHFKVLAVTKKSTHPEDGAAEGVKRMKSCIDQAMQDAGIQKGDLRGSGSGCRACSMPTRASFSV